MFLEVPKFNVLTKLSVFPKDILKEHVKSDTLLDKISELYYIGIISDEIFDDNQNNISMAETLNEKNEYNSIILFAIEMKEKPTDLIASPLNSVGTSSTERNKRSCRSIGHNEISELTRTFNRINRVRLVALLFRYKYEGKIFISFAISERFKYKQKWREGEKVGKIIVLSDINADKLHAGHERILTYLTKGKITSYNRLHDKLLEVFDLEILNKQFYRNIFN